MMKFPLLIENVLKCLGDPLNQRLLLTIADNGEFGLMFYSLQIRSGIKDEMEFYQHMSELNRAGLIYTQYIKNEYDNKYLKYTVSKLGKRAIHNIQNILKPYEEKKEDRS